ncbi:MAG: hypothetical protein J7M30_14390 [Deltaproteobacteria bacterium]|nr:hypothetical protein [Deltaproteobacteria bacterium]
MALVSRKPLIRRFVSDDCTNCGKCAGCGYCEHFCPVQNQSAIVVTPMGAIRMYERSYVAEGKNQGLNLSIRPKSAYDTQPEGEDWGKGFAPGFEDDKPGGD